MDCISQQISFDYKQILIDEIALEGLDGITLEMLWRRVEFRVKTQLTEKTKIRYWKCLNSNKEIFFYELECPREPFIIKDRFETILETTGQFLDPPEPLDGPYEFVVVPNEHGSSESYNKREQIKANSLSKLSLQEVIDKYGNKLLLVASFRERWRALAPDHCVSLVKNMSNIQYCFLELVGKGRAGGQTTVGTTNLTKLSRDPKLLFYYRKYLTKLGLLKTNAYTTFIGDRGIKTILITLSRFYKPPVMCVPNIGVFHDVYVYLKSKPDLTEATDVLYKKKLLNPALYKKWKKVWNIIKVDTAIEPRSEELLAVRKNLRKTVKRQYYRLNTEWNDSSDSEEETIEPSLESTPLVGISLYRQAFEKLLEAGGKGLKILELAKILNIDYYSARPIMSLFLRRKIVYEKTDDKGKTRCSRYIAIKTADLSPVCAEYTVQKEKLLGKIQECAKRHTAKSKEHEDTEPEEIPTKKIKLNEEDDINKIKVSIVDTSASKKFSEVLNAKKQTSMRTLQFANELVKMLDEKLCINGYLATCRAISAELKQPPLDSKVFRDMVYRLANDNVVRIYELTWPTTEPKVTTLICSIEVEPTDPIITSKQREIVIRSHVLESNRLKNLKKEVVNNEALNNEAIGNEAIVTDTLVNEAIITEAMKNEPIKNDEKMPPAEPKKNHLQTYARYLKLKMLHEIIFDFVYSDKHKNMLVDLPEGVASIVHLLPELKIDFIIGLQTNAKAQKLNIPDEKLLQEKLKNAPPGLFELKILQAQITDLLRMLACFGLVQLCTAVKNANDIHSGLLKYNFYVNRTAKIINTRGEWPRPVEDLKSLEMWFRLDTFEDVTKYWDTLFDVSTKTKVVDRPLSSEIRSNPKAPIRTIEEVKQHDNGELYGNGKGAAGLDNSFFIDQRKLWVRCHDVFEKYNFNKHVYTNNKPPAKISKKPKGLPIKRKPKKPAFKIKLSTVKPQVIPKLRKRINVKEITWKKWEDDIILLCKVAVTILSPTPQPGTLTIKNLVARDLITLKHPQKTPSTCHKRASVLELNNNLFRHERDRLLNEFKKYDHLVAKYEDSLRNIKKQNMHVLKQYVNKAKIVCFEIIYILLQLRKTSSYNKKIPCVAASIDEFHNKYAITSMSTNAYPNYFQSDPITVKEDIVSVVTKEALVMVSACRRETADHCSKIYNIFKNHTDDMLRLCMEHLRKCNAIAAKSKNFAHHINSVSNVETRHMTGIYRLSKTYEKRCSYYSKFLDNITNVMKEDLPNNVLGASDINTILLESQACNKLEILSLKAPGIVCDSNSFFDEHVCDKDIQNNFKFKVGMNGYKKIGEWDKLIDTFEPFDINSVEEDIMRSVLVEKPKENVEEKDPIMLFLVEKREIGATYQEIKKIWDGNDESLQQKLQDLEDNNLIKLCGFYENRLVATEHIAPWTMCIDNRLVIPAPWVSVEFQLNMDMFAKWSGAIVNYIVECPGKSLKQLSDSCESLSARHVQDACMFLSKVKCIRMNVIKQTELGLFVGDLDTNYYDFNKYEQPDSIVTFPVKDTLTRFAYIKSVLVKDLEEEVLNY